MLSIDRSGLNERLGTVWLVLVSLALCVHLGQSALIDPDEGRNAAAALEMSTSGDYVVPHLNGLPHLDKPVLFYAAGALSMRALGPTEGAARLPALLAAWATVALTVWFSAGLFGRKTAWIAGTVCATAPLTLAMARTVIFDSLLGFFVVLALMAFYRAIESERGLGWTLLAWSAMAGGVLTKGPVALLLPVLVAAPYAVWRRRSRAVWHPAGWIMLLLLVLPWLLAVERRIPGFLRYALVTETWSRLTSNELKRGGPIWYFLPYLLGGFFPWILAVAASGSRWWRQVRDREGAQEERRRLVFLALWVALPLLFFSFSHSKRPQYILPLVPAIALLTAWAWSGDRPRVIGVRSGAIGWAVLGGALLAVGLGAGSAALEAFPAARSTALLLGGLMLVAAVLAWLLARRQDLPVAALSLPLALFPLVSAPLVDEVSQTRSARNLAAELRPHLTADTKVVGVETFPPSLTFYLGHPIEVSAADGEPFRSNYISSSYQTLVERDSSPLHPAGWWHEALGPCSQPLIFLLRKRHQEERATLEKAGLPLLYEDDRIAALGPCRPPGGTPGRRSR